MLMIRGRGAWGAWGRAFCFEAHHAAEARVALERLLLSLVSADTPRVGTSRRGTRGPDKTGQTGMVKRILAGGQRPIRRDKRPQARSSAATRTCSLAALRRREKERTNDRVIACRGTVGQSSGPVGGARGP